MKVISLDNYTVGKMKVGADYVDLEVGKTYKVQKGKSLCIYAPISSSVVNEAWGCKAVFNLYLL